MINQIKQCRLESQCSEQTLAVVDDHDTGILPEPSRILCLNKLFITCPIVYKYIDM